MIQLDIIIKESIKGCNVKIPQIPNHPYKIRTTGVLGR